MWFQRVLQKNSRISSRALVKCRSDQKVIERIKMLGAQPVLSDGAEFAEFIKAEAQKWKTLAESISQAK